LILSTITGNDKGNFPAPNLKIQKYLHLLRHYQFQYSAFHIFRKFRRVNGDFNFQNGGLPPSWIFKFDFFSDP